MEVPMPDQPTPPSARHMSREAFEHLLLEVRNGASVSLAAQAFDEARDGPAQRAAFENTRAVWHASEVALGVLRPGYVPKREALTDVRAMLAWLDYGYQDWIAHG
jgi:hypothetical protein